MAYGVSGIDAVEAWTAASYAADDGALDLDVTSCMTNGTTGEDCDEWKEGTINGKITIDVDPAALLTLSIRFYLNSIMTGGDSSILAYTDSNSVSTTGENTASYASAGQWVDHGALGATFRGELGDIGGGKCAVRWASNDGAKSKLGEVNIDFTEYTFTLAGVTRDVDEAVMVSSEYNIMKRTGLAPETWALTVNGTSHGTTGAFSEEVARATYRIIAIKDVAPQIMDIGPPITGAQATASDDIFALGAFSGLANDDRVYIYQAGAAALPTGVSEDTLYHVVSQSGDTCKLSTSQGGAAVNITVDGDCWIVNEPVTS